MRQSALFGFTLAEVLITLGIIGVVAAITMPTLVQNYKKTVLVNQLKKAVSTLEQGFKKMLADEEVDSLYDTGVFQIITNDTNDCMSNYGEDVVCTKFVDALGHYFSIIDVSLPKGNNYIWKFSDNGSSDDMSNEQFIKFADGTYINMHFWGGINDKVVTDIYFDINGEKGPNTYGRDVFSLDLMKSGMLEDGAESSKCLTDWNSNGCFNRIIENGWKMDY